MSLLLDTAQRNVNEAADFLQFSQDEREEFMRPEQREVLRVPLGTMVIENPVVVHSSRLGVPRGGRTYAPGVTLGSVEGKSVMMGIKNGLQGIGSGKSGADIPQKLLDPNMPLHEQHLWRRELIRGFVREGVESGILTPDLHPRAYTFAPDENTGAFDSEQAVEAMYDLTGVWVPALATGKSPEKEGIEGREEGTGRGIVRTMRNAIINDEHLMSKDEITIAIHGFGNVASWIVQTMLEAQQAGDDVLGRCRVIAASDRFGGAYNEHGLPFGNFDMLRKQEHEKEVKMSLEEALDGDTLHISSNATLVVDTDIIIPAAVGDIICDASDMVADPSLAHKQPVMWQDVKASVIIEGGNGCLTYAAQQGLTQAGKSIYTGTEANRLGARLSLIEYHYGLSLMENSNIPAPTLTEVRRIGDEEMDRGFVAISEYAQRNKIARPLATTALSLERWRDAA